MSCGDRGSHPWHPHTSKPSNFVHNQPRIGFAPGQHQLRAFFPYPLKSIMPMERRLCFINLGLCNKHSPSCMVGEASLVQEGQQAHRTQLQLLRPCQHRGQCGLAGFHSRRWRSAGTAHSKQSGNARSAEAMSADRQSAPVSSDVHMSTITNTSASPGVSLICMAE